MIVYVSPVSAEDQIHQDTVICSKESCEKLSTFAEVEVINTGGDDSGHILKRDKDTYTVTTPVNSSLTTPVTTPVTTSVTSHVDNTTVVKDAITVNNTTESLPVSDDVDIDKEIEEVSKTTELLLERFDRDCEIEEVNKTTELLIERFDRGSQIKEVDKATDILLHRFEKDTETPREGLLTGSLSPGSEVSKKGVFEDEVDRKLHREDCDTDLKHINDVSISDHRSDVSNSLADFQGNNTTEENSQKSLLLGLDSSDRQKNVENNQVVTEDSDPVVVNTKYVSIKASPVDGVSVNEGAADLDTDFDTKMAATEAELEANRKVVESPRYANSCRYRWSKVKETKSKDIGFFPSYSQVSRDIYS